MENQARISVAIYVIRAGVTTRLGDVPAQARRTFGVSQLVAPEGARVR